MQLHPVIRFEVMMRDQRQCTYVDIANSRCSERERLEVHHVVEVSRGGDDSLDNLRTLCSKHHQLQHPQFTISSARPSQRRDRFGMWIGEQTALYG